MGLTFSYLLVGNLIRECVCVWWLCLCLVLMYLCYICVSLDDLDDVENGDQKEEEKYRVVLYTAQDEFMACCVITTREAPSVDPVNEGIYDRVLQFDPDCDPDDPFFDTPLGEQEQLILQLQGAQTQLVLTVFEKDDPLSPGGR